MSYYLSSASEHLDTHAYTDAFECLTRVSDVGSLNCTSMTPETNYNKQSLWMSHLHTYLPGATCSLYDMTNQRSVCFVSVCGSFFTSLSLSLVSSLVVVLEAANNHGEQTIGCLHYQLCLRESLGNVLLWCWIVWYYLIVSVGGEMCNVTSVFVNYPIYRSVRDAEIMCSCELLCVGVCSGVWQKMCTLIRCFTFMSGNIP